jgi:hypothetical protein
MDIIVYNLITIIGGGNTRWKFILWLKQDQNFTPEQQKQMSFFYLRGGFDYNKLKPVDKVLMTLLKWKLKRKKVLTPDERGMLNAYVMPLDATRKKNIEELIAFATAIKEDFKK